MVLRTRLVLLALTAAALLAAPARADRKAVSTNESLGKTAFQSAGPLAFGPEGVLFIGDPKGAAILAVETGDTKPEPTGPFKVEGIDDKIASLLGTEPNQILIQGLAVNPASGKAYLSVSRGRGPDATPVLVRVNHEGRVQEVPLAKLKVTKAVLPNAPAAQKRQDAITHLAYVDGRVFVAGLSNEEFASTLRAVPYPFQGAERGASVEIYHGSHGRLETNSPVRTFVPYDINGETFILAAYTCTPLVRIPVSQLKPGNHVKGVTVAELGNRNRPLDMIVYQKDGKDFLLMANSSRGVMKITTDAIDKAAGISAHVRDKAGLTYQTIAGLKGVEHLDRLDKENALVLVRGGSGSLNLESIALP
jgi:hypothetical protein